MLPFAQTYLFRVFQKGSTETRDPGSGKGITETERETEAEYAVLERRFQAIESKKNRCIYISNVNINKCINLIPGQRRLLYE